MSTSTESVGIPPGLKGVEVTRTEIGDVRGLEGFYHYRQYAAVELAEKRSLEDVWQLLLDGSLPVDRAASEEFAASVRANRALPTGVSAELPGTVAASSSADDLVGLNPLSCLRTGLSLVGSAWGLQPIWDLDAAGLRRDLIRVSAVTPTIVAAVHRLSRGLDPIPPDPELPHAANYLYMVTGERPDRELARALEQYLILTVDHGFNSSTFTARVIASTGADVAAAVVGAIGALSGPLHGGAPSRALETIHAIGSPERAEEYIRGLLSRGQRIMGFGHAVYRTEDPRSAMLSGVAQRIGGGLVDLAVQVEKTVLEVLAETKPERPLYTNVEYYAGVVMDRCGLPEDMFTATFAVSRVIGWCANIAEQARERKLIRPSARYVGPPPPVPVPEADWR